MQHLTGNHYLLNGKSVRLLDGGWLTTHTLSADERDYLRGFITRKNKTNDAT